MISSHCSRFCRVARAVYLGIARPTRDRKGDWTMRKSLISILAALGMLVLALSGCSLDSETSTAREAIIYCDPSDLADCSADEACVALDPSTGDDAYACSPGTCDPTDGTSCPTGSCCDDGVCLSHDGSISDGVCWSDPTETPDCSDPASDGSCPDDSGCPDGSSDCPGDPSDCADGAC